MNAQQRLLDLLVKAAQPARADEFRDQRKDEVDTSCPHVPFGFVLVRRLAMPAADSPDDFWSYCLATDQNIDVLPASIQSLDSTRLNGVSSVVDGDLARVGNRMDLRWLFDPVECFVVSGGCSSCGGQVLLVRTAEEAAYLHWHRES